MSRSEPKRAVASDVWRSMLQFSFMHQSRRWMSDAREMGLTPGHMKALMVLQPGELRPMGALAEAMGCDASTCTWLVDRLEERGLVERRPSTKDRRVKAVVLTPAGVEMKQSVHERMYEPPPDLLALDRDSLEKLRSALRTLPRPPHETAAADSA
ncbi:MAG: MarR family winged helix-turn-helix transcriptional regulator [Actinomycetota bacterium]